MTVWLENWLLVLFPEDEKSKISGLGNLQFLPGTCCLSSVFFFEILNRKANSQQPTSQIFLEAQCFYFLLFLKK